MSDYIFGRVLTAMVTPFNDDLSINYGVAEKLADYLVNNGSDGLVICGTTGESPTLESHEKYELLKVVKNAVVYLPITYCHFITVRNRWPCEQHRPRVIRSVAYSRLGKSEADKV